MSGEYGRTPFGTLLLPSRSDERQADKPEFICLNCGCAILRGDGGARWARGPGLWLVDEEGAEHIDDKLCAGIREGNR